MTVMAACALAALAALCAACGDDAPSGGPGDGSTACATPRAERYLPLAIGASWTYDTSDLGAPNVVKTSTVEALEDVGERKTGFTAYRIRTTKVGAGAGAGAGVVSWQEDHCDGITRHREQTYDTNAVLLSDQFYVPGKPRVDESAAHTAMGAAWVYEYTEVEVDPVNGTHTASKREDWTVDAVDEMITVPAGTFSTLRVRKRTSGQADKTYWFARGVGKIREQGEQVEILTAYTPAPEARR
jgi:hypothetical protein